MSFDVDFDCDNIVDKHCRHKVNLKSACKPGKGKHAFRDFSKACDNIDFMSINNDYSSLSSANMLYVSSGYQVHGSIDVIRSQSCVNSLANPINFDHMTGCCTCGAEPNDTYVWPLYGEVDNCIVHFTKTYWSDTLNTGTCYVYIQGLQHRGFVFVESRHVFGSIFTYQVHHSSYGLFRNH